MEWKGGRLFTLCLLVWWEFVIICIYYFSYWEISFEQSFGQIKGQQCASPLSNLESKALAVAGWPAPTPPTPLTLPIPFFACVSETPTYSQTRAAPSDRKGLWGTPPKAQLDGEVGLLLPCYPWEKKTQALESKKGLQQAPSAFQGNRVPLFAPLMAPQTLKATSATLSGNCSRLFPPVLLPRTVFSEIRFYTLQKELLSLFYIHM